jgi:hypothetical protein
MEDIDDQLWAEQAIKEWNASDKETVTLEEVEKQLGLDR